MRTCKASAVRVLLSRSLHVQQQEQNVCPGIDVPGWQQAEAGGTTLISASSALNAAMGKVAECTTEVLQNCLSTCLFLLGALHSTMPVAVVKSGGQAVPLHYQLHGCGAGCTTGSTSAAGCSATREARVAALGLGEEGPPEPACVLVVPGLALRADSMWMRHLAEHLAGLADSGRAPLACTSPVAKCGEMAARG